MRIDLISAFPHPLLGRGDDIIIGSYAVDSDRSKLPEGVIKINVQHKLSHPSIEGLIKEGSAVFAVEINCGATMYRRVETTDKMLQIIKIPEEKLRDRCDLQFFIISKNNLNPYSPSGINRDYKNAKFDVSKGDVIAYGGEGSFLAGREWVPSKEIRSIFRIQENLPPNSPMKILFGSDSIKIHLNTKDAEYIKRTAKIFPKSYVVSLCLPALTEALRFVYVSGEVDNEFPEGRPAWCDAIELKKESIDKIKDLPVSSDNVLTVAQIMLDLPIEKQGEELSGAREQMSQDD